MKKIYRNLFIVFLFSLFSLFFVACKKEEKPSKKEIIEKFVENSKNIKSADMISKITMEEEKNKNLELIMEASIITEPFIMKINTSLPMNSQKVEMYIQNENIYIFNPLTKQWNKFTDKILNEYLKSSLAKDDEVYDIIKNNIDKILLQEEDKYYLIKITEGASIFKDAIKKQITNLNFPNNTILDDFSIEDFLLTYKIDKNTYLPISSYNEFNIFIEGNKTYMSVDTEFKNINKVKEIKLPKELINN